MAPPLTSWQRFVARFLPWYDPDEQEARIRRTEAIVDEVGRIESIRIAYRRAGDRVERRRVSR